MIIGFTGTQLGMTRNQKQRVIELLDELLQLYGDSNFHEGDCVGADEEAAWIAEEIGWKVVSHPPENESKRAFYDAHETLPPKPYLERNRDIVNSCDRLIACPKEEVEVLRSGTWATIRYARAIGKPLTIIYPTGKVANENH